VIEGARQLVRCESGGPRGSKEFTRTERAAQTYQIERFSRRGSGRRDHAMHAQREMRCISQVELDEDWELPTRVGDWDDTKDGNDSAGQHCVQSERIPMQRKRRRSKAQVHSIDSQFPLWTGRAVRRGGAAAACLCALAMVLSTCLPSGDSSTASQSTQAAIVESASVHRAAPSPHPTTISPPPSISSPLPLPLPPSPSPPPPPLPSPLPSQPPPPRPPLSATWHHHPSKNCWWDGHGSQEVDSPNGTPVPGVTTLASCKAACLASDSCEGIVVQATGECFRKRSIVVRRCVDSHDFDLYVAAFAVPPPPPARPPPPVYPLPPLTGSAGELNDRFLSGKPSIELLEVGVLVHQDDKEIDKLWEAFTLEWDGQRARMAASIVNARVPYMFSTSGVRAQLLHCEHLR
jgi:hypothetical protein